MGWLRKAQSIPAFPVNTDLTIDRAPVRGAAFWDFIGQQDALYPEPNFMSNADVGFDKNELVYACIMEKATSLPDAPFRVFGPDGMGDPREDHPLRKLIADPNPACTEFELMELTSIYLDLAGIAFWEIVLDRADRPAELWPLRPDLVRIMPRRNGQHEYGYVIGGGRMVPLGTNVLTFKLPNPTEPWLGQAPMRPANRAVALDNEATDFVKSLLQNRAVPGTVIETEQKVTEDLVDRLTQKWIERFGGNNTGRPAFLQRGMKVHRLGLDLSQLEFPDLRTISESRICMSFGVPPILVGAKVGLDRSTFANYREARVSLWEETLMPLQKRMQQVIVKKLLPMLEGPRPRRTVCRFDNSEVLALREAEGKRWELATQALRAGGITVNQFCRYVGLPPVSGGDVYLRQAGVIPTDVIGNMVAENPAITISTSRQAAEQESGDDDPSTKPAEEDDDKYTADVAPEIKDLDEPALREFARDIADVVERQQEAVLAEIETTRSLLALAPELVTRWEDKGVWNSDKWDRQLAQAMEPHMRTSAYRGARKVDPDEPVDRMNGYITTAAKNTAREFNESTREAVMTAVTLGGSDVADNVGAIFALAKGSRAARLAQTLATEMNGFAKVDTAKRVGHTYKVWVVRSNNPRKEHLQMAGDTVPVGEPFSNGMQWPGGPNCQCDVIFTEGTN